MFQFRTEKHQFAFEDIKSQSQTSIAIKLLRLVIVIGLAFLPKVKYNTFSRFRFLTEVRSLKLKFILLLINLHSHPFHFQPVTSDDTWPGCQRYHDKIKALPNLDRSLVEKILTPELERLKTEFDQKLAKLKEIHIAHVNKSIRKTLNWPSIKTKIS